MDAEVSGLFLQALARTTAGSLASSPLRMVNAADLGRPLNPKIVETQLSGAAVMQLGFTLILIFCRQAHQHEEGHRIHREPLPAGQDLDAAHAPRQTQVPGAALCWLFARQLI